MTEPGTSTLPGLHILIVDDEALARARLHTLLDDLNRTGQEPAIARISEADDAHQAQRLLAQGDIDVVLLDIHMPGLDGLQLAHTLRDQGTQVPAIVFVTAYAEHAVTAFELDATDYLTKPVRLPRLQHALQKIKRLSSHPSPAAEPGFDSLLVHDRGRTERIPLTEVLCLKAELKYVTVCTAHRNHILDASLSELESRYAPWFLRIHRNALVARKAIRTLEKHFDPEEGECWAVRLQGLAEPLAVSRRQLAAVRHALGD